MDASTTVRHTRTEQCKKNARAKSEQKRQAVRDALAHLIQERQSITKAAVARRAGVSLVFLRSHTDLVQTIDEAMQARVVSPPLGVVASPVKDQVVAALRRRLEEMKQQLAAKDQELRGKQREIDLLYGKLAAGSQLTDADLRCALTFALQRLAVQGLVPETSGKWSET